MSWKTKQLIGATENISSALLACCYNMGSAGVCDGPFGGDCNSKVYVSMCRHPEVLKDQYCVNYYGIEESNNNGISPTKNIALATLCNRVGWTQSECTDAIVGNTILKDQQSSDLYTKCIKNNNPIIDNTGNFLSQLDCGDYCNAPLDTSDPKSASGVAAKKSFCVSKLKNDCNRLNVKDNLCSCFQTMDTIANIDQRYAKYKGSHIDPICIYDVCQNNGYYDDTMLKRASATCPSCIQIVDLEQSQSPIIAGQNQAQVNLNCGSGQGANQDLLKQHDKTYEALQESIQENNKQSNTALQTLINAFVIVVIVIISIIVLGTIMIIIKKKSNNNN